MNKTSAAVAMFSLSFAAFGASHETVTSLVNVFPSPQQVAFSAPNGCRYTGGLSFDNTSHIWAMTINSEICGTVMTGISAHVLPAQIGRVVSEAEPILRAGDTAFLIRDQ